MKSDSVDKRTARTKITLHNALLELLKTKKVSEVSVHELCEKADINRGTFYKYYKNVQDILSITENELFKQYAELFSEITALSNPDIFIYECLKLVKKNGQACRLLLAAKEYDFITKISVIAHDFIISYWRKRFNCDDIELLKGIYTFVSWGTFGLIEKWIGNDFDISPPVLANAINQASDKSVETLIEVARPYRGEKY